MENYRINLIRAPWGWTAFVWKVRPHGRSTRAYAVGTYQIPSSSAASPSALLEALSTEMALPPGQRYNPTP